MILAEMVYLDVPIALASVSPNRSTLDCVGLENKAKRDKECRNDGVRKVDGRIGRRTECSGKIMAIGICRIMKSAGLSEGQKLNKRTEITYINNNIT